MGNLVRTVLFLIVSAFLTHLIPFSDFFRNLNTMVHEFAHAVMTLLLSGSVMYIELYSNHSGVTYTQVASQWSLIPISLAGYMSASLFAVLLFRLRFYGRERFGLLLMVMIAVVSLILFVRNEAGVTWLIGFILLTVLMMVLAPRWIRDLYYLLLSFLMLEETVFSSVSLMVYAWNDPASAGDAANLSMVTPLPALGWAIFFSIFSVWCASAALRYFVRGRAASRRSGMPSRSYLEE